MMRPMSGNRMQSRFRRRWLAAFLLCLIVVLTLTHIPRDALPRMLQRSMLDKAEHVVAYGMIAMLFLLSLRGPRASRPAGGRSCWCWPGSAFSMKRRSLSSTASPASGTTRPIWSASPRRARFFLSCSG